MVLWPSQVYDKNPHTKKEGAFLVIGSHAGVPTVLSYHGFVVFSWYPWIMWPEWCGHMITSSCLPLPLWAHTMPQPLINSPVPFNSKYIFTMIRMGNSKWTSMFRKHNLCLNDYVWHFINVSDWWFINRLYQKCIHTYYNLNFWITLVAASNPDIIKTVDKRHKMNHQT